jgi:hypothetical protein
MMVSTSAFTPGRPKGCTLVLFHHGSYEPFVEIELTSEFKIGNVYTVMVFGIWWLIHIPARLICQAENLFLKMYG